MSKHDDISASSIDNPDEACVIGSIENAMPPPPSSARIPRVPKILLSKKSDIYDTYYVPKVVSIGPYHHNNQKLELVEKLKPVFTKKLLSKYNVGLSTLYKKLGEANMVQDLRNFYEATSTDMFSDQVFTKMMILDGCFILYYIVFIYGEKAGSCQELRSHEIEFIQQNLFLLENQIPFKVLNEVMHLIKLDNIVDKIGSFLIHCNILVPVTYKGRWFGCWTQNDQIEADHLLHSLHSSLTRTSDLDESWVRIQIPITRTSGMMFTFRNVNDLVDAGIRFKPGGIMSLAHVNFVERFWWKFFADIELPPITLSDSTKPMLLNLIAYEMCEDEGYSWVTSYICLLDSLIYYPEDVNALRKAYVLYTVGSDEEVATMFDELSTYLVPNNLAYSNVKNHIQRHYDNRRHIAFSTLVLQLKHEYIKNPWSYIALLGAVLALFLSAVQTYFTVWAPKAKC